MEGELIYFFYIALSGLALSLLGMYVGTACISLGSSLLLLFGIPQLLTNRKKLPLQTLSIAYLALLISVILSVLFADPYPFWKPLLKLRYFLCLFVSSWLFFREPRIRSWICKVALALSFILGILAPLQVLGVLSIPELLLGVEPNPLTGFPHFFQATGLLRHHTAFGLSVIYLFHLLLAELLYSEGEKKQKWLFIGCGFCVIAIFCSFSRGTWLTWLISTVFVLFLHGDRRKKIGALSLIALLIVGTLAVSPSFRERISSFSLNQNTDRVELYRFALDEFTKRPVFGHGYGRFAFELEKYPERQLRSGGHGHAHNIYLDMGAGAGLLGLLSLLWFLFLIGKKIIGGYQINSDNPVGRSWFLGLSGIFVAFSFGGLFDEFILWNQTLIPTLVFLGSAFAFGASPQK